MVSKLIEFGAIIEHSAVPLPNDCLPTYIPGIKLTTCELTVNIVPVFVLSRHCEHTEEVINRSCGEA